jgi:hypothetical protein
MQELEVRPAVIWQASSKDYSGKEASTAEADLMLPQHSVSAKEILNTATLTRGKAEAINVLACI